MEKESLRVHIEMFVQLLRADGGSEIGAPFVADSVCKEFPHWAELTRMERDAVYIGVSSVARDVLRNSHDSEYDPNQIAQQNLDLPEANLLNDGYSVMRNREPVYVPRQMMKRADMEYVCRKFDKLSEHFSRHSRALRAEFERRIKDEATA